MKVGEHVRQGDVLVVRIASRPGRVSKWRAGRRQVLALGESTGHSHRVEGRSLMLGLEDVDERFFDVLREGGALPDGSVVSGFLKILADGGVLVHEEHGVIELPTGDYAIVRQREYSPEEIRTVAD